MPRRATHTANTTNGRSKTDDAYSIKVERPSLRQRFSTFFLDPRTRMVSGCLLLAVALLLLIAYCSFFFTGHADQSLLGMTHDERVEHRLEIQNWLGLPGAAVADFLIDGAFGVAAVLWVVLLVVYGVRLLKVRIERLPVLRTSFCTAFWLLWLPVFFGFLQQVIPVGSFRWGGAYGAWFAHLMTSYIQPVGFCIVWFVLLLIFFILSDREFIPHVRLFGQWCKALFRRKPKSVPTDTDLADGMEENIVGADEPNDIVPDEPTADDTHSQTIDIEFVESPDGKADNGFKFIVEETPTEDTAEENDTDDHTREDNADAAEAPLDDADNEDGEGLDIDINCPNPVELAADDPERILQELGPYDPRKDLEYYQFPSQDLLKVYDNETAPVINHEEQQTNALRIKTTLSNYGIEIESIKATVGPTVTLYEIVPKAGIRIAKIKSLENDIMMSLSARGIRIIAPMPGKGTVGIEVPNENAQIVSMHSVIASKRFQEEQKMRLPIAIGRTITNDVFLFDLAKTPHLLVAGATGQGKSVAINAIITSLLYKKHPAELKLVLVDPKMVEFAPYKPLLRHYLAAMPDVDENDIVITDCDKVVNTLNSLVIEMENRYKLLMDAGVRNLEDYNDKFIRRRLNPTKLVADSLHHRFLPYIVIIIDEYGDFIMQAGKQVETPIARITQKARAVGMHMILATQRPSVNIVTGIIKANIPTRIALRTQSVIDSRTVLDSTGAEHLIGRGDMLYAANGGITRIQCAFVDTPEVDEIVDHISHQQRYTEPYQLPEYIPEGQEGEALAPGSVDMKRLDPMFADVARYVVTKQEGSTSRLQRAFEIGYNRAGKLSDQLEAAGIVGPNKGPKGREVLISDLDALDRILQDLGVN